MSTARSEERGSFPMAVVILTASAAALSGIQMSVAALLDIQVSAAALSDIQVYLEFFTV